MSGFYVLITIVAILMVFGLLGVAGIVAETNKILGGLIDVLSKSTNLFEKELAAIKQYGEYTAYGERFNVLMQIEETTKEIQKCIAEERYEDVAKLKQRLQEYNKFLGIKL